jgi:hypothetical protein
MTRSILWSFAASALVAVSCSVVNAPDDPQSPNEGGGGSGNGNPDGGQGATGGACEVTCEPAHTSDPICNGTDCGYGTCDSGFQDCDGDTANGCESAQQSDPANCGMCDADCANAPFENVATLLCDAGMCDWSGCNAGFDDCNMSPGDGCERALDTVESCGGCEVPCMPANVNAAECPGGMCGYDTCAAGFQDCNGNTGDGCETPLDSLQHCGMCMNPCNMNEQCVGGTCQGFRPNVHLCGTTSNPVTEFFPPMTNFTVVNNCNANNQAQAMFVTRSFSGLTQATLQSYLQNGGIVITEWNISDEVYSLAFQTVAQGPTFLGACADTIPTITQFTPNDPFWADNVFMPMQQSNSGCGYSVAAFPMITPLAGWSATEVALAYRDLGQGRLWLVDADWQDGGNADPFIPYTNQLMGYMMTHK